MAQNTQASSRESQLKTSSQNAPKFVFGRLRGQGCFFPRTLEEAFGNGPAITAYRRRRWLRRNPGGAYAPNSYDIPWREWRHAILPVTLLAAFVLVAVFVGPHVF